MSEITLHFDVAIVGAGPVGCAAALAHARAGASVLLLEANPKSCQRLAGEWLHPRGVEVLRELGVDLSALAPYETGRGFAVHPADGGASVVLPYAGGARGFSGEHAALVELLRGAASAHPRVRYEPHARVTGVEPGRLAFVKGAPAREAEVFAARILGADGRRSRVRAALGLASPRATLSRMAGVRLRDVRLPAEGFGHVLLGGPGPMLAYRIAPDAVRLCLDVPLAAEASREWLLAAYGPALPTELRAGLARALADGDLLWALNESRARADHGRPELALLGDAAGFQHPLTAAGITLGLCDAAELARTRDFESWQRARRRSARMPQLLASALYDAFSLESAPARAIRRGVFSLWRRSARARERSMRYLAAEDGQLASFAGTFVRVALPALASEVWSGLWRRDFGAVSAAMRELGGRTRWLLAGLLGRAAIEAPREEGGARGQRGLDAPSARLAVERGAEALIAKQRGDGRWEGEVVWCAMLAAQYVMAAHVLGLELPAERRAGLLLHFRRTQLQSGLWGLHPLSEPYLFATTLVYVAARLLGEPAEAQWLARARSFIHREGVLAIPSWGKLWLALLGLYDWRGVPPLLPELWALPRWLPLHPSRFYCHTRHIYLAMSVLFARRVRGPESALLSELREELHPNGLERVDWNAARGKLRAAELVTPPGFALRLAYRALALYDRHHSARLRQRVLGELEERIRWELRTTDHTSLSPVSGLLNVLALTVRDRGDADAARAIARLDAWMWQDEREGLRIAGARSATWDTAFALQALSNAAPVPIAAPALERGAKFLAAQQVHQTFSGHRSAFRLDPRGGFCFAEVRHGWPVSDCTAEALDSLAMGGGGWVSAGDEREAVRFMLRCQNRDGGFGSYEARRGRLGLEWLNPAEMFGESMTEHSYVECTGSCLAALAGFRRRSPDELRGEVERAIARAERRLRRLQRRDGSWRGVWGVQFVYGTLFGVRGLMAAGATRDDPALRRACAWLRSHQRADGGWGEHHSGCAPGEYREHPVSQVLQTAWALLALLEAEDADSDAISRGARFLIDAQQSDGDWPKQDPAGLFFRTALLEYELYRAYFPLWALALYERRRSGARAEWLQ